MRPKPAEMQDTLSRRFGDEHGITKIIPNFYRNIKAHDAFVGTARAALNRVCSLR